MSKSLGNFFTIREIFEKETQQWPEAVVGEMLRYFLLSTHYRGPLDFSDQSLHEAKNALDGFYDLFKRLGEGEQGTPLDEEARTIIDRARLAYRQKLDDDLNTPMALAVLQNMRSNVNKRLQRWASTESRKRTRAAFREFGAVLGLFQLEPEQWQFNPSRYAVELEGTLRSSVRVMPSQLTFPSDNKDDNERVQQKIDERNEARRRRDFKVADAIRVELESEGITIEDKPDGTSRWKR